MILLLGCVGLQSLPAEDKDAPGRDPGGGPDSGSPIDSAGDSNNEPLADAGDDVETFVGVVVRLDGGGSYDPDGDRLDYLWSIDNAPSGSSARLTDDEDVDPQFTPDREGTYVLSLVVSDGALDSEPDDVEIVATVNNGEPVADAGADQTVSVNATVTLDGSGSTDPDGDRLTYAWTLSTKPSGSAATLASSTSARPTFRADVDGVFEATLTVSDGTATSSPDKVRVVAEASGSGGGGGGSGGGGSSGCGCSGGDKDTLVVGVALLAFYGGRRSLRRRA